MYNLSLIQVDTFNDKIKRNAGQLTTTGSAEHNLLYLNSILADTKCLIKHFRNSLEI